MGEKGYGKGEIDLFMVQLGEMIAVGGARGARLEIVIIDRLSLNEVDAACGGGDIIPAPVESFPPDVDTVIGTVIQVAGERNRQAPATAAKIEDCVRPLDSSPNRSHIVARK